MSRFDREVIGSLYHDVDEGVRWELGAISPMGRMWWPGDCNRPMRGCEGGEIPRSCIIRRECQCDGWYRQRVGQSDTSSDGPRDGPVSHQSICICFGRFKLCGVNDLRVEDPNGMNRSLNSFICLPTYRIYKQCDLYNFFSIPLPKW